MDYRGGRGGYQDRRSFGGDRPKTRPSKTLFVKNLSYDVDRDSLRDIFDGAMNTRVAMDRESGQSRGFGYVEYESIDAAQKVLNEMQGYNLDGRELFLDFAAERSDAPRGGGGYGGGGGGYGGGGGGYGGGGGGYGGGGGGYGGGGGGYGGGGRSGGGSGCHNCGEEGHFARECPSGGGGGGRRGGGRGGGGGGCHNCGEDGHYARECPSSGGGGRGGRGGGYQAY